MEMQREGNDFRVGTSQSEGRVVPKNIHPPFPKDLFWFEPDTPSPPSLLKGFWLLRPLPHKISNDLPWGCL